MKINLFLVLVTVVLSLVFLTVIIPIQKPLVSAKETYITGMVIDELGNPVGGARVTTEEYSFITKDDGLYVIKTTKAKDEIVVNVFKEGYYPFMEKIPRDNDIVLSKIEKEELPPFTKPLTQITKKGYNLYIYASSNPDPEKSLIAVEALGPESLNFDIWLIDANGVRKEKIATEGIDGHPRWSPDGTKIVFHSKLPTGYNIYLWDFKTKEITEIDRGLTPAWDPNGKEIIYAKPDEEGKKQLWIKKVINKEVIRETPATRISIKLPEGKELPGEKSYPDWSLNGIVFSRKIDEQTFEIWKGKRDGEEILELIRLTPRTSPGKELGPVWSTDGSKIAYWLIEPGQPPSIWWMNQDGTERTFWLKEAANPTWIPDTSELIFEGTFTGSAQIWRGSP